jgi:serine protease Do/serine protease DegQ
MKLKLPLGIVMATFAATSLLWFGLQAKESASSADKKPDVRVDTSPLDRVGGALVTSYADVIEPVQQAVVSVYSTKVVTQRIPANPLLRQFFGDTSDQVRERKEEGLGSGVIVSTDGYIITNNHVIEGADELSVLLPDEREFKARLIGKDPKTDIAVIKIEAENLPTVTLADSDNVRVGDVVFAVGNPLGVGQTVTMGIVSARGRKNLGLLENVQGYEDFIQTDAAINMGNSGGALVDAMGRLVGVNSAIISTTRGNIGIGFAIPVNLAASIMRSLIETGTVARGFLGVTTESVTPEMVEALGLPKGTRGLAVADITPDSPAEKAGLQRTDIILAVNGRTIASLEDLRLVIAQSAPGSRVVLRVVRDGKELDVEVILGILAENPNELLPGVEVTGLTDELRRRLNIDPRVTGLVIAKVDEKSPYADRLAPNVVIIEINRSPVVDLAGAKALLREGQRNLLLVHFRGGFRYVTLTVR